MSVWCRSAELDVYGGDAMSIRKIWGASDGSPGFSVLSFKKVFYLFLKRGEGREKERERNTIGCLSHTPNWGPGLQPKRVP